MRTFLRVLIIALCSLILGVILNAGNDQGIHWKVLLTANPLVIRSDAEVFVPADRAYFYLMGDEAVFLDVRPFDEYEMDHIPGALPLRVNTLLSSPQIIQSVDADRMIIIYGYESDAEEAEALAQIVRRSGYRMTMLLEGGFAAWLDRELPVTEGRLP